MKNLYLKLTLLDGKMKTYKATKAINRILSRIRHVQFKKAYVKVSYGKKLDVYGKMTMFYNDGYYTNPEKLAEVTQIFWNEI